MEVSKDLVTSCLISSIVFYLIYLAWSLRNIYQFFEVRGMKGPRPYPFLGNIPHMLMNNQANLHRNWVKKYGKVFGLFFGWRPRLFVADPEVMLQICVKDFDIFPNHTVNPMQSDYQNNFLVFLKDDHWRKVRALTTPTFTSSKIRRMFKLIDVCADDLMDCFHEQLKDDYYDDYDYDYDHDGFNSKIVEKKLSEPTKRKSAIVNGKEIYSLYTLDSLQSCCFSMKMQRAVGSKNIESIASRNEFAAKCLEMFKFGKLRLIAGAILPKPIVDWIRKRSFHEFEVVANILRKLISDRRKLIGAKKFDDFLQQLLDAKLLKSGELGLDKMDNEESHHVGLNEKSMQDNQRNLVERLTRNKSSNMSAANESGSLTEMDILSNTMFLMIVGLETTGTALSHCTYLLAFHQLQQEKLYEEIREIAKLDESTGKFRFEYDTLTSCKYLDAVVSETLRCIPTIFYLDRVSNRDYYIEKYNITIPKGTVIMLAYHHIHHDPDYWYEPEKFDPERFMPGNKEKIVPGSYFPFSVGPRHCLGMRFSLTEMKLALAKLIMHFKITPAPGTMFPPETKYLVGINLVKKPLVRLEPREKI